ncbi:hypothetical protein GLYMA_18G110800v4 [Glycine max]|nr:hypothetical protein GLYMA_18G110800v4 [Glycine max]KAH1154087.1 hypothetical protein GYH30_049634 [Glycine max]
MDKLLVLLGQDHAISLVAGNYCIWLIPALFGYVVLQALLSGGRSLELLVILAGPPNPKLETSFLSICLKICNLHYFIPYGTGAAVRRTTGSIRCAKGGWRAQEVHLLNTKSRKSRENKPSIDSSNEVIQNHHSIIEKSAQFGEDCWPVCLCWPQKD